MINDHPSFPDLCEGLTDIVNVKWNILDYQTSMIKHTILPMISRKQINHVINQSKRMKLDLGLCFEHFPALVTYHSLAVDSEDCIIRRQKDPQDVTCCDHTGDWLPRYTKVPMKTCQEHLNRAKSAAV
jgi:hypothetical protein